MEQICEFDVFLQLIRKEGHIRDLAKRLDTNHTTTSRILKKLTEKNIIDSKTHGRNKTYHIKNSLESEAYAHMAENHRKIRLIKKHPRIRKITAEIKKRPDIPYAVVYGSYAKEKEKQGSDIDLYIETQDPQVKEELEAIDTKLSIKTGKYDPENPLIKEIKKDHVILKGVEEYYERLGIYKDAI